MKTVKPFFIWEKTLVLMTFYSKWQQYRVKK